MAVTLVCDEKRGQRRRPNRAWTGRPSGLGLDVSVDRPYNRSLGLIISLDLPITTGKEMAMIQAYLDESGIHDGAGVCAIAGYFGGPGQWKKLGSEWREVIRRHNVPEFHAKEFWGFAPNGERVGPYRGWSKLKADVFLDQLVRTIESRDKIHPVSCA